jgi:hypothetical protein
MNYYWLINVRCREFQELEPEPKITSRFILCTPEATEPSVRLISDLISELRLKDLPGVSATTTDYRIGPLIGQIDTFVARKPDLKTDKRKVWLLQRPAKGHPTRRWSEQLPDACSHFR